MTRERFHAIFLAAIMVLSVVAMGAGFVGSAAADSSSVVVGADGDYSSIQTAIDEEGADTSIIVKDGEYSNFVVDVNNVSVTAAEGATPTISGSSNVESYQTTVGINADQAEISGLNIDANEVGIFVVVGSSEVIINDNSIEVPSGGNGEANGILTQYGGTSDLEIHNNTFTTPHGAAYNHVYVGGGGSSSVNVTENTFEGSVGFAVGVAAEQTRVVDNDLSSVTITQEKGVAVEVFSDSDPTISGNEGSLVDVVPAEGNSDTNKLYSTVQAGIDSASKGDTVEVRPGIYKENVEIETGIQLVGNGATISPESGRAIDIKAQEGNIENLTISGFHLTTGDGAIVLQSNSAVNTEYNGQNYTYEDLVIEPNGNAGVGLFDVKSATLANVTVTGSSVESAGAVELIGVSNIDVLNSNISNNNNGIRVLSVEGYEANEDINIENSTISGNNNFGLKNADDATEIDATSNWWGSDSGPEDGAVSGNVDVNPWLDAPIDQSGDKVVAATVGDEQFSTIQSAVAAAEDGDTVNVQSGQYTENITMATANVSLSGEADPVINGRIDIKSDEVTVQDITVRNGAPSGSEVEGIFVGNPAGFDDRDGKVTIQNVTVEDIYPHGTSNTLEGIHVKHYDDGENIDGVEIDDVTVRNVTGPSGAGANGVKLQAEISDISIVNSTIDDVEGGWAYGVSSTWSSGESGAPVDVKVSETTISKIDGVGFHVAADDGSNFADPTEITVEQNSFIDNRFDIYNANTSATLQAPFNYYGEDSSPLVGGNVVYDPFLTVESDQVDADPISETTDYGHDLIVPANGKPHSVAFPAPVEGNVSEVFGEFNGTVYAYDGDEWESGEEIADKDVDALDAFVVTVDEDEEYLQIEFQYAESDDPVPSMTTTDLEAGWNFVGAPTGNAGSDEAFAGSTADVTTVIDALAGQNTASTPYGLDASGEVSNPSSVSPFKGYWVFVTDDGELGATVPVDPTQETEEGALTGN